MEDPMFCNPAEEKKQQTQYEGLKALYPQDLAREMVKAYLDARPPPTISDEELKEFSRRALGEKLNEVPVSTPEWDADYDADEIEREVETAVAHMSASWILILRLARKQAGGGDVRLTELLDVPVQFSSHQDQKTWQEAVCVSIMLTLEQVNKLHEAFAAKLRPLIDVAPDGYVLWGDFLVKKDAQGYCLLAPSARQP